MNGAEARIRLAGAEDAAELAAVHVKTWQTAYRGILSDTFLKGLSVAERESAWRARLGDKAITTFLAEEAGRVVGFITGGRSRDPDSAQSVAEVYAIYVDQAHSRRGIGTALLRQQIERMKALGFEEIVLWVLSANAPARAFYERLMMHRDEDASRQIEIGGSSYTEVRYGLRIGGVA